MYFSRKIAKQREIIMVHLCCPVLRCHGYSEGRIWAIPTRSGHLTSAFERHVSPRKSDFDLEHLKCVSPRSRKGLVRLLPI